jgi:hypothetical protein
MTTFLILAVVWCSAVGGQQSAESPPQSLIAAKESRARVDNKTNRNARSLCANYRAMPSPIPGELL